MRKLIFMLVLCGPVLMAQPHMIPAPLIAFPDSLPISSISRATLNHSIILVNFSVLPSAQKLNDAEQQFGLSDTLISASEKLNQPDLLKWYVVRRPLTKTLLTDLKSRLNEIKWIAPIYENNNSIQQGLTENGRFAIVPDALLLKSAAPISAPQQRILDYYHLTRDNEKSSYLGRYGYYNFDGSDPMRIFEIVRGIRFSNVFSAADSLNMCFETMPFLVPGQSHSSTGHNWNIENISADKAWKVSRGSPTVTIAVIDTGCDRNQGDTRNGDLDLLTGARLCNLNAAGDTFGPDNHGTKVAGLAAATIDNKRGIDGVAGGCKILPLAFCFYTNVEVAIGINYAVSKNARVINMSFGSMAWEEQPIVDAIRDAYIHDVVLIASAGNCSNPTLNYGLFFPASHPFVMAIGGSTKDDFHDPISVFKDDDYGYGKTGISSVAPSSNVPVLGGISISGTSASAPHVSGLAALLISFSPGLSNVQVRDLIESNADKVGEVAGLSYSRMPGFPKGTRTTQMGYGRINAAKSISALPGASIAADVTQSKLKWYWWVIILLAAGFVIYLIVKSFKS